MNGGKKVFLNVPLFYVLSLDPDMILLGKFSLREKGSQMGKYARETIESVVQGEDCNMFLCCRRLPCSTQWPQQATFPPP